MSDLPSWCRVGQRVVYLGPEKDLESYEDYTLPTKGKAYTIREVCSYPLHGTGLRLLELINVPSLTTEGVLEVSFWWKRFQPVVTKTIEDDVAIFVPLLQTKKEEELV